MTKTDPLDIFLDFLNSQGISYKINNQLVGADENAEKHTVVTIDESCNKVQGYSGFYTYFKFVKHPLNFNTVLKEIGIYE